MAMYAFAYILNLSGPVFVANAAHVAVMVHVEVVPLLIVNAEMADVVPYASILMFPDVISVDGGILIGVPNVIGKIALPEFVFIPTM